MDNDSSQIIRILAPAKINLFLHVTGRRDDGYHTLDSLVAFADIGDEIVFEPSVDFSFSVEGPFSDAFCAAERDESPDSSNLAVRAVWQVSSIARKTPSFKVTLVKNLPVASGIGGGSADAAAVVWELVRRWRLPREEVFISEIMNELGADIPVCLECLPVRMQGKGEVLTPVSCGLPEIPFVLVNPGKVCSTAKVFRAYGGDYKEDISFPENFKGLTDLVDFLHSCDNDLTDTALDNVPEIKKVLYELEQNDSSMISRMCGSGASCYALFDNFAQARECAKNISNRYPSWWIKAGWLNRVQRY